MLTCENIACRRGDRLVFEHLGVTIGAGTPLVLRGANGSGKSSLLKIMAGLNRPEQGRVLWDKEPIGYYADYGQAIHYIGHDNALKPQLTVLENLMFWASLREAEIMAPAALTYFRLEDKADMPVNWLSAGWKRRVALATLLASQAKLWLLDEPTTNLDEEGKEILQNVMNTRLEQGGMIVIATHAVELVPKASMLHLSDFMPEEAAA